MPDTNTHPILAPAPVIDHHQYTTRPGTQDLPTPPRPAHTTTTTTPHHTLTSQHLPRSSPVSSSSSLSRSPPAPHTPVGPPPARKTLLSSPTRSHVDPWSAVDSAREGTLTSPRLATHGSTARSSISPRLPPALHVVKYEAADDDDDEEDGDQFDNETGDGDEDVYYDVEKARAAPSHRHRSRRRSAKYHVPWISFHLSLLAPLVSLCVCLYAAIVTPLLLVAAPALLFLYRARPAIDSTAPSPQQVSTTPSCSLKRLLSRALAPALHLQLHLIYSSRCNKYHHHHHHHHRATHKRPAPTNRHTSPGTREKHLSVSTAASSKTGSSSPAHHHHYHHHHHHRQLPTATARQQHAPSSAQTSPHPPPLLRMLFVTLLSPLPALAVAVGGWTCSLFWLLSSILDTNPPQTQQGRRRRRRRWWWWSACHVESSSMSRSSFDGNGPARGSRQASSRDLFPDVVAGPSSVQGKQGNDGRQAVLAVRRVWERWLLLGW